MRTTNTEERGMKPPKQTQQNQTKQNKRMEKETFPTFLSLSLYVVPVCPSRSGTNKPVMTVTNSNNHRRRRCHRQV